MSLTISLLGTARAERDSEPVKGIRGRKAWAILAYLLLVGAPVPRQRLAAMFFPDATDPAGVLRWNLSQLRRHLGVELAGDPLGLVLPDDAVIDVSLLHGAELADSAALCGLGQELLAGPGPHASPEFEVWLEAERRHLRALSADLLREAALQRLARGERDQAVALAERVVELEPLDENAAVLLVRALRMAGRADEARSVATSTTDRLRRELGTGPSAALTAALHASRDAGGHTGNARPFVEANREAGVAALAAGASEAGIDLLREALGGARALGQPDLLSETLTSLGSALIHAVRGADQDAVGLLHEAVCLYESVGDPASTATAMRELGYVEMLRGRYPRADVWFTRAAGVAGLHDAERAWIGTYSGAAQCDVADYPRARRTLDDAVARAHAAGPPPVQTLAQSMRGRLHLATGDLDAAATDLDQAIQLGVEHGLRTLVPWPMTIRAEIDLATGGVTAGMDRLEHAYATARQISDPCWEAMALRGLGLGHVHLGHLERGVALLEAAPTECRRLPDTYRWIEAHALDSLAAVSVRRGLDGAARWVQILEDLTTAHGMRQFSLNAARYRAALGDPGAAALAQTRHEALTVDTTIDPGKAP